MILNGAQDILVLAFGLRANLKSFNSTAALHLARRKFCNRSRSSFQQTSHDELVDTTGTKTLEDAEDP